MEQTFWGKLKRVRLSDLLHIFKFLAAWVICLFLRGKHRDLWLICDTENEARDNGYWLFQYVREHHPEQEAVYAINRHSPDYERVAKFGRTVHYGSLKHWIYYLLASKNISSQKMGKPNAAICYVLEVYGILKNVRVFLQHGIIMADLSYLYYPHTRMRLFVCSTYKEWKYVNDNYGYPQGYVQQLGICRLDGLHDFRVKQGQILIMPTWRMYIRNEIRSASHEKALEEFQTTEYFRYWNALLNHEGLYELAEKYDLQIVFYPHREMQRFLDAFQISHPRVTVASWPQYDVQELLKSSAYLITDFSSVALDFAYMKKPLLYYQFDTEKYRQSHNASGDFDYEKDGFGPVVHDADEIIAKLKERAGSGFENEEVYLKRHAAYFDLWDKDNCRRNYEAIKSI